MNQLKFAEVLWTKLGTPLSLKLLAAYRKGDWETIVNTKVDPRSYTTPFEYLMDAIAGGLLRKAKDIPLTSVDKRRKALETFWDGERKCKLTNLRLAPYLTCKGDDWDPGINVHLEGIRRVLKRVLGTPPTRERLQGRFGPGATFTDPSVRSTLGDKMNSRPSWTPTMADKYFGLWELTLWGRSCFSGTCQRWPSYTRGGRFATAPKDATKDRPLEVGPSINVFYQLGVDGAIRPRLKRWGIDLTNGQSTHVEIARLASMTGDYATLDLKNASGTVSRNLVRLLAPPGWLDLFEELRSSHIKIDNQWVRLEQYSGMGNGYTFSLETTIFFAIAQYVHETFGSKGRVYVYGDDLIVPSEEVGYLVPLLRFLGFELNDDKSFSKGPFRESCGGDFFAGMSVRPFFLKEISLDSPDKVIAAANGLRKALEQHPVLWELCKAAWFALLDLLPVDIRRLRGPHGLGDIVIHDERSRWQTRTRSGIRYIQVFRPVTRGFWPRVRNGKVPLGIFDEDVQLACAIYGAADDGIVGGTGTTGSPRYQLPSLTPRDAVTGHKIGWTAYS